jgi:hypothetical protein
MNDYETNLEQVFVNIAILTTVKHNNTLLCLSTMLHF